MREVELDMYTRATARVSQEDAETMEVGLEAAPNSDKCLLIETQQSSTLGDIYRVRAIYCTHGCSTFDAVAVFPSQNEMSAAFPCPYVHCSCTRCWKRRGAHNVCGMSSGRICFT